MQARSCDLLATMIYSGSHSQEGAEPGVSPGMTAPECMFLTTVLSSFFLTDPVWKMHRMSALNALKVKRPKPGH